MMSTRNYVIICIAGLFGMGATYSFGIYLQLCLKPWNFSNKNISALGLAVGLGVFIGTVLLNLLSIYYLI